MTTTIEEEGCQLPAALLALETAHAALSDQIERLTRQRFALSASIKSLQAAIDLAPAPAEGGWLPAAAWEAATAPIAVDVAAGAPTPPPPSRVASVTAPAGSFVCMECSRPFASSAGLAVHIGRSHPELRLPREVRVQRTPLVPPNGDSTPVPTYDLEDVARCYLLGPANEPPAPRIAERFFLKPLDALAAIAAARDARLIPGAPAELQQVGELVAAACAVGHMSPIAYVYENSSYPSKGAAAAAISEAADYGLVYR